MCVDVIFKTTINQIDFISIWKHFSKGGKFCYNTNKKNKNPKDFSFIVL